MAEKKIASSLNLYQKLAKIRQLTEVLAKNKKGYGYKYVSIDEILARVSAGMNKYNVSLIPQIVSDKSSVSPYTYTKTKVTNKGEQLSETINEMVVEAQVCYTWVNNDDPEETLTIPWFIASSQADPSQAFGSALTYGLRYFLMQFFQIASPEDDPDAWRSKQQEAAETEGRQIAEKIVDHIHTLVTDHTAANPDDRKKIIDITKKFVRENKKPSANYFAITDPEVATKLLAELKKEVFGNDEEEEKE